MSFDSEGSIETIFQLESLQTIVDEVGSLIRHDLCICNRSGVIIAATRRDRIGVTNESVREMIEKNREMHIVPVVNNESFFRPGINLPIRYGKRSVGCVGITGDPEEVKDMGRLIQAMVQQQLKDLAYQLDEAEKKRILSDFVYSWIYKGNVQKKNEFRVRSRSLGIDIDIPRIICILDIRQGDATILLDKTGDRILQHVETRMKALDDKNIVTMLDSRITVMLHGSDIALARQQMEHLQADIRLNFNILCAVGISTSFISINDAKAQYEVAKQACRVSKNNPSRPICVFSPNSFESVVASIRSEDRKRIFDAFFHNYKTEGAIRDTVVFMNCYADCNRSLTAVAEKMNMHKNTVQQRLDKIAELTGYNPRLSRDLAYIILILQIYKLDV